MKKFFKKSQSEGQGLVEFALIIPILMLVIFGLIEAGRLLFITIAINSSSREAARYGASVGELGQERYKDCAGIREAARRLGSLAGVGDDDITITYDNGPDTPLVASDCPPTGVDLGNRIVVNVNTLYTPLVPIVNLPPFPIQSRTGRTILTKVPVGDAVIPPATPPNVSFKSYISPEPTGDEGTIIQVVVELSTVTNQNVVVNFQVSGGTAEEGVDKDYTVQASQTGASEYEISIPPGSLSAAINISASEDDIADDDETVNLLINNAINANLVNPTAVTVTINEPDPPVVSFAPGAQLVVEESTGSATVDVEMDKPSTGNVSVPISFSSCSLDCTPYTITPSPIVFNPGETLKTVIITWLDDFIVEENENLNLALGAPVDDSYILGPTPTHSFTVLDDDTPTVEFASAEQSSSETDGETIVVVVSLDPCDPVNDTVVNFTVTGVSTAEPEDYTISTSSPITFSAVDPCVPTTQNIIITIEGDDIAEGDETIVLEITGVSTNAELGSQDTHTITIEDDETTEVDIITPDQTSIEADEETKAIELQLSVESESDVSVPFSLSGTATEGADYTVTTSSPVVFSPGETSKTIEISVIDDGTDEITETVKVSLGTPVNAEKGSDTEYQLEIVDDDGTGAEPDIVVTKEDFHVGDTDGTGTITVGDILEYQIDIMNNGGPASDVVFTDSPDIDTNIVDGSVTTSRGTITSGNGPGDTTITVNIGSLGGGETVTVSFQVEIENTMAPGDAIISNQGTVSMTDFPNVPSDDPVTTAEDDPTQTEVTRCPVGLPPSIVGGKISWPIQNPVVGQVHTLTRVSIQWTEMGLKSIAFAGWIHSPSGGTASPISYQVDSGVDANIPLSVTFSPTTLNMVFTFDGNQLPGLLNLQADFNGCQTISPPGY